MITYTFIVGYGYVEESRGTKAIVNFYTEEKDVKKVVQEFLKTLRSCFYDRGEVQNFLRCFFDDVADGLEGASELEIFSNWNWWGSIQSGHIIELQGLDLFFDEDDDFNANYPYFTYHGTVSTDDSKETRIDVEEIYEAILGDETEEEEEEELSEGEFMFPHSMKITYNVQFWKSKFEIIVQTPNGMKFHLDKFFHKDTEEDIDKWVTSHVAKNAVRDNGLDRDN